MGDTPAADAEKTPPSPQSKGHVLVVDDELAIVRAYMRALTSAGYDVQSAPDGIAATELLDTNHFDAIVSDIAMPGLDGIGLLRATRERDLDVPVILITGTPSVETALEAVEAGALLYLVKPIDVRSLLQVVEHAVRLHAVAKLKREAIAHLGGLDRQVGDRTGLEVTFRRALSTLWMAYQPIVQWSERGVYAYEALVRSNEPMLPHPGALLDAAERLGRLPELGRTIRERIAEQVNDVPEGAEVFVNLHTSDLNDEALYSPDAPLSKHAARIVLEITERASLDGVRDVPARVARLRGMGFRIAVDDLGAGYAGLTSFSQLKPEVVKLDMSLVRDVHAEPVKRKLVASMASLCRDLGMLVVAEGVETVEERDALVSFGCDLLQGYLFAKPGKTFPSVTF